MAILRDILKKRAKAAALYIALGVASAFLSSFSVKYFQVLLDQFTAGSLTLSTVLVYDFALITLFILNYLDNIPDQRLNNGIYLDLKLSALKKLTTIDYLSYLGIGTGRLISRVEHGAHAGSTLFSFWFRIARELAPSILFSMIFILGINKEIALTVLIGYAVVFIITNLLLRALYRIKERILVNEEQLNHYLVRGFMEFVLFRLNRRLGDEIKKSQQATKAIVSARVHMTMIHEAFFTVFALLIALIKIAVIVYAWQSGQLSVGAVVALIALVDGAYSPIAIFNVLYVQYKLDKTAFDRFLEFMNAPDDRNISIGEDVRISDGHISMEGITLKYGDRLILDNFSLDIPAGKTLALVGESGSGKSTLARLLTGLIKPCAGTILIDGQPLQDMRLESLYEHIFYITQEAPVFDGTLRENVVFDEPISDEQIVDALSRTGLRELLDKLPDGLDTRLGERGVTLSGGERQRLALSRLWFSRAKLVILDEATAAMDNLTEQVVIEEVMRKVCGRTVITIAHRLGTVRGYDTIVAMKDGRVIGTGQFDELLSESAYFRELYMRDGTDCFNGT